MSNLYTINRIRPTMHTEEPVTRKKTLLTLWLEKNQTTQAELAGEVGITVNYLNNLLNRHHKNIKIDLLRRLSKVTGIEMQKLVDDLLAGFEPTKRGAA